MELTVKKPSLFRGITPIALIVGFILVACGNLSQATQLPEPIATEFQQLSPTPSMTLTQTRMMVSTTHTPTPIVLEYVQSYKAGDYVGETITVKIEKAYCSYRPDVSGAPTFCNDQPFPNHTFTLITWGKDWTDLDGKCIYVEGVIEVYKGKLEIIVDSRDQVMVCE